MDEPTSGVNSNILLIFKILFTGLDSVGRREYWEIMKGLKKEKRSIIFTTQFLDEAEELADQIAVLSQGKIYPCSLFITTIKENWLLLEVQTTLRQSLELGLL